MTKTTLTIDGDLHVTKVCGINVMTNDANNRLGVIELDCKTEEDTRLLISMDLNAVEPVIFAEEIGKTLFGEEVALPYDDTVIILESVTDEPLKSIAQILLNTLTDNRGGIAMNKLKKIPTPILDLAVTDILSITVAHMDDCHNLLNELGSVSIYCKTNDEIISAEITSYNLETGKPETIVHFYGAESADDVVHVNFNRLIDILKTVQD